MTRKESRHTNVQNFPTEQTTLVNESWHTFKYVASHIEKGHVTPRKKQCRRSHVTHTYKTLRPSKRPLWTSHGTRVNVSRRVSGKIVSVVSRLSKSHVTGTYESLNRAEDSRGRVMCVCVMTHSDVWCDFFRCVMCDVRYSYVWHDLFTRVACLMREFHMYVWHDSFRCVTWLLQICDVRYSYVWHDSFRCVMWLFQMCDVNYSYMKLDVSTRIACMIVRFHTYAWRDSLKGVIRLINAKGDSYTSVVWVAGFFPQKSH